MTSSSFDLLLPKRFFSLSLFLLLDEPQPRKTMAKITITIKMAYSIIGAALS